MHKRLLLYILLLFTTLFYSEINAQTVEITGRVDGRDDVENIHVINKSSKMFTTTNVLGGFKISAKYRDTIQFTSVQYKTATIVVSYKHIQEKSIEVFLEEQINVLDEVIIGKVLTGKIETDVKNSDAKRPIDFYDVGLPGYTGKPLTQSERRLHEATKTQLGLIPILPLINAISGRTRMLKKRVELERISGLINSIKDRLSKDFFKVFPLSITRHEEFFYFCSEDPEFEERCGRKSDILIFEFLEEKYIEYKDNLENEKD
jgi:hypothetical protein